MSLLTRFSWLLRGVLRRKRLEQDMDAEMRFHMAAYIEDQVRSGVTQDEAERRARIEFGVVASVKEQCREARGFLMFDELRQDLRYAFRVLRTTPAFTAVATLTLAVGIGANASIYSLVNAWILRPLPYADAGRLVTVWSLETKRGTRYNLAPGDLYDWRVQNPVFESVAGWKGSSFTLSGHEGAERIDGARVNANFFHVLGAAPALGRDFAAQDDEAGAPAVAIVSDEFWRNRFGADCAVVGRAVVLDGEPVTVIGIMPRGFHLTLAGRVDIWTPLALKSATRQTRGSTSLRAIARLKAGSGRTQAQAYLTACARRLAHAYPQIYGNRGFEVRSLREEIGDQAESGTVLIVFGIVGCVLLIACTNVANLLLGRAACRQKEMGLRLAIGASRFRLMRQLLVENLLLFLAGGALGTFVSVWGVRWLDTSLPQEVRGFLPGNGALHVDLPVLLYTFAIALTAGLVFGIAPALNAIRSKPYGARSTAHWKKALVVAELSLALVVLVTAGLSMKSMIRIYGVNPGFDPGNLVTAKIALTGSTYEEPARVEAFYSDLLERIRSTPGMTDAGASRYIPFCNFNGNITYFVEGRPEPPLGETFAAEITWVTPGYMSALGVRLIEGRLFTDQDRAQTVPAIIVSRRMAERAWPGQDPIGRGIRLGNSTAAVRTVIGVVENVKVVDLKDPPLSEVYAPFYQAPARSMYVVVRTAGDPARAVSAIRSAAAAVDKGQPVTISQRWREGSRWSTQAARSWRRL